MSDYNDTQIKISLQVFAYFSPKEAAMRFAFNVEFHKS